MRNYSYGAKAPNHNEELVRQELITAHRYYNDLIVIERERKELRDALYKNLKDARPEGDKTPVRLTEEHRAQLKVYDDTRWDKIRVARGMRGCSWGTGGRVEKAVDQAAQSVLKVDGAKPHFREWTGGGTVSVQLQGGLSVTDLLACTDTQAQLHGTGKYRVLWIRIGSNGRDPIWAEFPVIYHRDLPPTAIVKEVCVIVRRVATKLIYAAQFVLEGVGSSRPPPTKGTVAVDVGWRRFAKNGMRVAMWKDDTGETGELRYPERILERWKKTEDLVSIRAKNFNAALATLCSARKEASGWPEWLTEWTQHAHQWEAIGRLTGLVTKWRERHFTGDEEVFAVLEAWRKQDNHLYEWEANQRENVLRARREMYRLFACFLATYREVVFEELDLRDFAELPEEGEEKDSPQTKGARPRRFKACLSELKACAKDAVLRAGGEWIEVPPEYTTQTCAACGVVREFNAAVELRHTCTSCGATWDQDVNACDNLLRAAKSEALTLARSHAKLAAATKETVAERKRKKGLATRRARRSQQVVQDAITTTDV